MVDRAGRTSTTFRLAAVLTAVVLAACSPGGESEQPTAPATFGLATEASTEPSPVPSGIEPRFAVPDEITKQYAEDVVNALYEAEGQVFAQIAQRPDSDTSLPTENHLQELGSVVSGERFLRREQELREGATDPAKRKNWAQPYRGFRFSAQKLVRGTRECIIVIGALDFSGTAASPPTGPELLYVASLTPLQDDVAGNNPTPWTLADNLAGVDRQGNRIPHRQVLASTLRDFGTSLTHNCDATRSHR